MSVRSGFIVLAVVSPFLAACAVFVSNADSCSVDPKDRPVEVMRLPQVQEVPEQEANVIVEVKGSSEDRARTSFRFGDDLAFDVELPANASECAHRPIYAFSYDLAPGRVTVTAVTNGQEDKKTTEVSTAPIWLVLQVQDGFPTRVSYPSEPAWG